MPEVPIATQQVILASTEPWYVKLFTAVLPTIILNPMTFIGLGLIMFNTYWSAVIVPKLMEDQRAQMRQLSDGNSIAAEKAHLTFEKALGSLSKSLNENTQAIIKLTIIREREAARQP